MSARFYAVLALLEGKLFTRYERDELIRELKRRTS